MQTTVRILRGRYRGRTGTIPGTLEQRAARGITRALVKIQGINETDCAVLSTASLAAVTQLELFPSGPIPPSTIPDQATGRREAR